MNKYLKVSDIVHSVSNTHKFNYEKLYAVNTSDVLDGDLISPQLLPIEELKGQFKKTFKKDDILFSEIRPANRRFAKIDIEDTQQYIASTKLMVLRKFNDDVDLDYFYYWLTNNAFLKVLQSRAENRIGSFPQITFDILSEYVVPLPSKDKQQKISKLLKLIDNKIHNNNQIITLLESMAKTLYDYWFLQFEFPNADGKPYKSSGGKMVYNEQLKKGIPEGWEVKTLSQISNMYQPSTFDAKLLEDNGMYRVYGAGGYMGQYHEYNHEEQEIFISCRGSCGNIYKSMPKSLITGNAMIVHPNDDIIFDYLYYTLLRYGVKQCITGSVQPQITRDSLNDWKLILPPKNILQKFNLLTIPTCSRMNDVIEENKELASLRDFLLPLFMNGQVTVNDEKEDLENKVKQTIILSYAERFAKWKKAQGYAARGDVDDEILKKIFDAMEEDDKK